MPTWLGSGGVTNRSTGVPRWSAVLASLFALGALFLFTNYPNITYEEGSTPEYHFDAECASVAVSDTGWDSLDMNGSRLNQSFTMSSSDMDELQELRRSQEREAGEHNILVQNISEQIAADCDRKRTKYVAMMGLLLAPATVLAAFSLRNVGRRAQDDTPPTPEVPPAS
jgi:hypothetical protein